MVHTAARPGNKKRPAAKIKRRREQTAAKSRTMSGGKSVLWGLTGAYLLTMGGLLLCSLLLDWGLLAGTQQQYVLLVMIISLASVFIGSFVSTKMSEEDGFKFGLMTGILYILIRFLISWLVNGADLFVGNIFMELISCLAMACLGALLGRKKKNSK